MESAAGDDGTLKAGCGNTEIVSIRIPFKVLDCLITNFHLPEIYAGSLLVSALAQRACTHAYEEAIRLKYRFSQFGDAMFLYGFLYKRQQIA